jgi:hypothetical protein
MKDGKLSQMSDIMCPTDWDLAGFKEMMMPHLKKDKSEWKFYDQIVEDWNLKHKGKKPLSEFLKFMLEKVKLSV